MLSGFPKSHIIKMADRYREKQQVSSLEGELKLTHSNQSQQSITAINHNFN